MIPVIKSYIYHIFNFVFFIILGIESYEYITKPEYQEFLSGINFPLMFVLIHLILLEIFLMIPTGVLTIREVLKSKTNKVDLYTGITFLNFSVFFLYFISFGFKSNLFEDILDIKYGSLF